MVSIRGMIEKFLDERRDFFDGLVFPDTCHCLTDDLFPGEHCPLPECEASHKVPCECGGARERGRVMWRLNIEPGITISKERLNDPFVTEGLHVQNQDGQISKALKIANNCLYFDDSADYRSGLFEVCLALGMSEETIGKRYIED